VSRDRPRVLCAPDSLKGVLPAREAAAALAEGVRGAGAGAVELPLADGGEGTADVLASVPGDWGSAVVADPLGRPVEARFWLGADGSGVVEAAEAIGLGRLAPDELDPLRASSRGLGELVLAAVAAGAERVTVALGGTATVDGGAGLLEVLPRLPVPTVAACDVRSPLLGPRGAARLFGPQKGASREVVTVLEERLASAARLAPYAELPGAGAAGGLGAALASLGAELRPGLELVLRATGFRARLQTAALVVTGEGSVDASSIEGKVTAGVVAECARAGVPAIVFGGRVEPEGRAALLAAGAADVVALSGRPERARGDLAGLGRALAGRVG
jgi:glycerate kinase